MKKHPLDRDMGLYLHIPFCKQKCAYCDFSSYENLQAYYEPYVEALCKELVLWRERFPLETGQTISTIYFGGGTPTQLSIEQLSRIIDTIQTHYILSQDTVMPLDMTIEANPGEIEKDYLQSLFDLGFTRLSIGVQTFKESLLQILRRGHTKEEALQVIQWAHELGFPAISMDLIYGLPNQTLEDVKEDLAIVQQLPIHHLSMYGLQVEEGTLLAREVQEGRWILPEEDLVDSMYDTMIDTLEDMGFERYEISNFAKSGSYSRHNLKYWHYVDYMGVGVGAHSFLNGVRREHPAYVAPYLQALSEHRLPYVEEEVISQERAMEDFAYLSLRTRWGLQVGDFQKRFQQSVLDLFGHEIDSLVKSGFLGYDNSGEGSYHLTKRGAKYGNYVFSQFIKENS